MRISSLHDLAACRRFRINLLEDRNYLVFGQVL